MVKCDFKVWLQDIGKIMVWQNKTAYFDFTIYKPEMYLNLSFQFNMFTLFYPKQNSYKLWY